MFESLARLTDKIESAKTQLQSMQTSGVYNPDYIKKKADEIVTAIRKDRSDYYHNRSTELKAKLNYLTTKYRTHLSDSEVNRELLRIKQLEGEVRFMDNKELEATASKFINGGDVDYHLLNLVGSELRARGEADKANGMSPNKLQLVGQIKEQMTQRNIKEPWKNDPEYAGAQREVDVIEVVSGPNHDDYIYPGLGTESMQEINIAAGFAPYGVTSTADTLSAISRKNQIWELNR